MSWSAGQAYVALSRATSLSGLDLVSRVKVEDLNCVDETVKRFYRVAGFWAVMQQRGWEGGVGGVLEGEGVEREERELGLWRDLPVERERQVKRGGGVAGEAWGGGGK